MPHLSDLEGGFPRRVSVDPHPMRRYPGGAVVFIHSCHTFSVEKSGEIYQKIGILSPVLRSICHVFNSFYPRILMPGDGL